MCYMKTVTHREMRNNSAEILRSVAAGETVQVTNNGVIAAVISPPGPSSLAVLVERGQARAAKGPASELAKLKPRKPRKGVPSSREILEDSRGRF
jgi:prevent-host-death family protein